MSVCNCFGAQGRVTDDLGDKDGQSKPSQSLEAGLQKQDLRKSGGSMRRRSDALPSLPEHPEEVKPSSVMCNFPSGLLVNAQSLSKSFSVVPEETNGINAVNGHTSINGTKEVKRQSLVEKKIMASYDSVLMDTESTLLGMDGQSVRSSLAPSSRNDNQEDEDYDNFGTPQWTIDPHDIFFVARNDSSSKVCRIGRGEHGPVYLGIWQEQEVAVKLSKQRPTSFRAERQFHAKVAQLFSISHPNIVKFYGACFWKGGKRCVALTEYMEKGSLTTMLGNGQQTQRQTVTIGYDIAKGLDHLHANGVVHGRVKSSNILFPNDMRAKIAVPCLSTLLNHVRSHASKSKIQQYEPMLIAPEIAKGGAKSLAADIFCYGSLLWQLFTNEEPSSKGGFRSLRSPSEAPPKIAWLVESCLDEDPDARPSAKMIVSILKSHLAM